MCRRSGVDADTGRKGLPLKECPTHIEDGFCSRNHYVGAILYALENFEFSMVDAPLCDMSIRPLLPQYSGQGERQASMGRFKRRVFCPVSLYLTFSG
jgi:hypothetical protein